MLSHVCIVDIYMGEEQMYCDSKLARYNYLEKKEKTKGMNNGASVASKNSTSNNPFHMIFTDHYASPLIRSFNWQSMELLPGY